MWNAILWQLQHHPDQWTTNIVALHMPQKESLEKKAFSASVMSSRDYGDHKSTTNTTNVNQFSVNKTFLFFFTKLLYSFEHVEYNAHLCYFVLFVLFDIPWSLLPPHICIKLLEIVTLNVTCGVKRYKKDNRSFIFVCIIPLNSGFLLISITAVNVSATPLRKSFWHTFHGPLHGFQTHFMLSVKHFCQLRDFIYFASSTCILPRQQSQRVWRRGRATIQTDFNLCCHKTIQCVWVSLRSNLPERDLDLSEGLRLP